MAMTHVVKPSMGAVGTARQSRTGSNINTGIDLLNGTHNNRRSPTNIKTNPNYSAGQQRPSPNPSTGSETEEHSRKGNRLRSKIILGTAGSGSNRSRKKHKDRDKHGGRSKAVSNPDIRHARPRGSSNPDIGQSLSRDHKLPKEDARPRRPRAGSESNILDDEDLDRPEYESGLSSPDLGQNKARKLKQSKKTSVSLDVLRRSHDCLRTGINGTCKCTVKFYRSQSFGADKNSAPRAMSGIIPRMVANNMEGGSSRHSKGKNISDSDVSVFFKPSPTVWDSPLLGTSALQPGKLNRPHSVDATTSLGTSEVRAPTTASLRASFLRPKSQHELPKPWALRPLKAFDNLAVTKPAATEHQPRGVDSSKNKRQENDLNKTDEQERDTSVKRSTSLPAPRPWQRYGPLGSHMKDLQGTENGSAPPKPPRSIVQMLNSGNNTTNGDSEQAISQISKSPSKQMIPESKMDTKKKVEQTRVGPVSVLPAPQSKTSSVSPATAKLTSPIELDTKPEAKESPPKPTTGTAGSPIELDTTPVEKERPMPSTVKANLTSDTSTVPVRSLTTSVNKEYKPLYSQLMTPSNRWFTPYASTASTYFVHSRSALPPGRYPSSYGYSSKEEKAKVLALLDRYASSGRSNLGLTRTEMTNYLNSTKKQLGLKKENSNNEQSDIFENQDNNKQDINKYKTTEASISGEQSENAGMNIMNVFPHDSNDDKDNQHSATDNTKLFEKGKVEPTIDKRKIVRYENTNLSYPETKLSNMSNRMPSMITFDHKKEYLRKAPVEQRYHVLDNSKLLSGVKNLDKTRPTQTTFHVDGAITESPAVRRRVLTKSNSRPEHPDDVNNNDEKLTGSRPSVHSVPCDNEGLEDVGAKPMYSVNIPGYDMWRMRGTSSLDNSVPEELLHTGITESDYADGRQHLDECTRHKHLLNTLNTWLFGSYLALFFVVVWLVGFIVCYFAGVVPQLSAGLLFLVAILLISAAGGAIQHVKSKVNQKLQNALMRANMLFMQHNLLVTIVGGKSLAITIHFAHIDISQCQERIAVLISDKNLEDLLLTEVSRQYPCLMDIISQHLTATSDSAEDIGKQVIATDILMYFAASYLEVFLFSNKKSSKNRNKALHHKQGCPCAYLSRRFPGIFDEADSRDHLLMKKQASKPTLL